MENSMREKATFASAFLLCFLIIPISCLGFSEREGVLSTWPASPIIIDGLDEEWAEEVVCFENKYKVKYGFKNDENNLYILFKFNDLSYLSSIDNTGMIIWLSSEKEKKKDYGIRFLRKKVPTETFLYLLDQQRGAIPEEDKEQIRKKPFHFVYSIQVIRKKESSSEIVKNQESLHAHFRCISAKERVTYEFVIPFKMEGDFASRTGIKPGQIMNVNFEWGGLTEEMKKERIKRIQEKAEQQGAPEARIEEDLRRERALDTDVNKPSSDFKKYAFWVKVRLAMQG